MNSKTARGSVPKPVCPHCERPLTWLAAQIHGRFCSGECRTKYQELMTKLAMERLHAAMPKRPEKAAARSTTIVIATGAESPVS